MDNDDFVFVLNDSYKILETDLLIVNCDVMIMDSGSPDCLLIVGIYIFYFLKREVLIVIIIIIIFNFQDVFSSSPICNRSLDWDGY